MTIRRKVIPLQASPPHVSWPMHTVAADKAPCAVRARRRDTVDAHDLGTGWQPRGDLLTRARPHRAGGIMRPRTAHFIGIAGAGMSATAKLLKDSGVTVTGSDEHVYPPVSQFLADQALSYKTPYAAENIPTGVDLIVI